MPDPYDIRGAVACGTATPCGNSLRVYDVLEDALILTCLNGHHHRVGAPPPELPGYGKGRAKDPLESALRRAR